MPRTSPARDYSDLPEAELVRLARAGYREAFAAIMQRCNQRLFRVARSVLRDEGEAEDVLQDTYINAFRKLDSFRGESSLLTWLTRITLNEARGRLRRRKDTVPLENHASESPEESRVILFPTVAAGPDPESSAAQAQMRRVLERAIDGLPEPFRLVFVMRDVEECSIADTAAQLGIRAETVKTRLHRARKLLRAALDEEMGRSLKDSFPFLGARCARLTQRVLQRLEELDEEKG
jgi:RNA polymerase sigma-70 factor (ECF subfamily)